MTAHADPQPLEVPPDPLAIARGEPSATAQSGVIATGARASVSCSADTLDLRFQAPDAPSARITIRGPGSPGATTVSVSGLERRCSDGDVSFDQRAFVLHDLPCAMVEWSGPPDNALHVELDIRLERNSEINVRQRAGFARIDAGSASILLLTHADTRIGIRPVGDGAACVFDFGAAQHRRIAIASASIPGDDAAACLDAARNADARVRARRATLRRRDRECLSLTASDPAAGRIIRTAVHRLDAVPSPAQRSDAGPSRGRTGARLVLAALAAGEFELAHHLASKLAGPDPTMTAALTAWSGLPTDNADREPPDFTGSPPPDRDAACRIVALDPLMTASVADPLLGLAFDILGAVPDAARGRIRLRPVMPEAWDRFEIRNLAMADARFRLLVVRSPDRLSIEIEQTDGAIPVRAILEPVVHARALVGAVVDGQPATLTPRPAGPRITVPVQLSLDHPRSLTLDLT